MNTPRTIPATALCVSLASLFTVASLFAQPGSQTKGNYNPQTVETVSGVVATVDRVSPAEGSSYGVHLTLKTDTETISVHLGPAWHIERQEIKIAAGDQIEVQGSRITHEGKPAIIAAVVTKGNQQLRLRNANGIPLWSGGKHK